MKDSSCANIVNIFEHWFPTEVVFVHLDRGIQCGARRSFIIISLKTTSPQVQCYFFSESNCEKVLKYFISRKLTFPSLRIKAFLRFPLTPIVIVMARPNPTQASRVCFTFKQITHPPPHTLISVGLGPDIPYQTKLAKQNSPQLSGGVIGNKLVNCINWVAEPKLP